MRNAMSIYVWREKEKKQTSVPCAAIADRQKCSFFSGFDSLLCSYLNKKAENFSPLYFLVASRGIEPLIPPWKGGVLTAWPWGHKHDTFLLYLFAAPKSSIFCKFCQQNHKKNHPFSRVAYFYLRLLRFAFASLPPQAIPIPVPIRPKTKKSQAPTAGM